MTRTDSVSRNYSPSLLRCGVDGTLQITACPDLLDFPTEARSRRRHGVYTPASTTDEEQVFFSYKVQQILLADNQVEEGIFPHGDRKELASL